MPGAGEVEFEAQGRAPVLEIIVNREALRRYNLHAADVNRTIATALAGQTVGLVYEGNRRHEIVVRLQGELRDRIEEIRDLPVRVGEHGLVPLGAGGRVQHGGQRGPDRARGRPSPRGPDGQPARARRGELRQGGRGASIAAQVQLPDGYSLEFGGQFKNLQEARIRLLIVVPAALVLIFLLIFMAFGSLRQAFLIYTGIPLAVTGGVLALWLRGMPFSITAAVGFIALSGVAVLNGVVMISYFNELREQGRAMCQAVFEGALTRLRPVLMTAFVASLGFRADGHRHRPRRRSAAPAGHGRHRRHPQLHLPHAGACCRCSTSGSSANAAPRRHRQNRKPLIKPVRHKNAFVSATVCRRFHYRMSGSTGIWIRAPSAFAGKADSVLRGTRFPSLSKRGNQRMRSASAPIAVFRQRRTSAL